MMLIVMLAVMSFLISSCWLMSFVMSLCQSRCHRVGCDVIMSVVKLFVMPSVVMSLLMTVVVLSCQL